MKTRTAVAIGALLMSVTSGVMAERRFKSLWRGTGGWGDKSAYCQLFNPKTIETRNGVVVSVDNVIPMPGMKQGVELQLKSDKGLIPIQLGPLWYLENQDIDIAPGDTVEVTGSRFHCVDRDVIAATEVRHGPKTIKLRDPNGRPLWVAG